MRPCFAFKNAATADKPASLAIFDEIGFWGVQAVDFRNDLKKIDAKELDVEINSPGGDVFAGLAIYNLLKNSGKTINVKVMGVAASAASVIAMAGDTIEMPKNTFLMVHNPWTIAAGNADELRSEADVLDKIGTSLQGIYTARSGQSAEKVSELLAVDTWLTADEALALGFATKVTDEVKAKAKFDTARAALPANVQAALDASGADPVEQDPIEDEGLVDPVETTPLADEILALAKAGGVESHGTVFALACATLDEAKTRIAAARDIVALCKVGKRPDDATGFIAKNTSVADVRAALIRAQVAADVHTSNVQTTKQPEPAPAVAVKPASQVYADRAASTKAGRSANRK